MSFKIDLHVHTCYSGDCTTTLEEVISYARKRGLDGVAITDHDTISGAMRLLERKDTDLLIIPGIEVSTDQGHVLGINVRTPIPLSLSLKETMEKIHEAGGIAIAPHPASIFKSGIGLDSKVISYGLDAVEVLNSANFPFSPLNYLSKRFADRTGLPQTAGSDSHLPETIGLAYTIIESNGPEPEIEDVIEAVKKGMTVTLGDATPWRLRLRKIMRR